MGYTTQNGNLTAFHFQTNPGLEQLRFPKYGHVNFPNRSMKHHFNPARDLWMTNLLSCGSPVEYDESKESNCWPSIWPVPKSAKVALSGFEPLELTNVIHMKSINNQNNKNEAGRTGEMLSVFFCPPCPPLLNLRIGVYASRSMTKSVKVKPSGRKVVPADGFGRGFQRGKFWVPCHFRIGVFPQAISPMTWFFCPCSCTHQHQRNWHMDVDPPRLALHGTMMYHGHCWLLRVRLP